MNFKTKSVFLFFILLLILLTTGSFAETEPKSQYLIYSTYLGGEGYEHYYYGTGIAVDAEGNIYVTGTTNSNDFPTTPGAYSTYNGNGDVFIAKFSSQGNLIWSILLGGSGEDYSSGITVDLNGNVYITGGTSSSDFPVTLDAYDTSYNGAWNVFVTKINSTGTELIYCTYLGGTYGDYGEDIAVDADGNAYVTGYAGSFDFPVTLGAYDKTHYGSGEAFATKINPTGTELVYSTFLNVFASGRGIAVDADGDAYVVASNAKRSRGYDVFITKINSTGTELIYSTYLGGKETDVGFAIAVDADKNVYVTGCTNSSDFPTTLGAWDTSYNGDYDIFVAKINSTGAKLLYSTYLGGSGRDTNEVRGGIAVDTKGRVYVAGNTQSIDFPITSDAYDSTYNGNGDVFVTKILISVGLNISAAIGGTTDPEPGIYIYEEGIEVIVKAIPNSGYEFSGWSGDAGGTDNTITIVLDKDKSITANFKAQTPPDKPREKGGCFIATAAYGSPLHSYVRILRDFRDKYLMPCQLGHALVDFYYRHSPLVADLIAGNKALKVAVRISLLPFVAFSYSMLHLGPIITAVILVFICGLPIFFITFFRRRMRRAEANDPKAPASR